VSYCERDYLDRVASDDHQADGRGRDEDFSSPPRTDPGVRAQGLRLREVLLMQAIRHGTMLPSLQRNEIGTSEQATIASEMKRPTQAALFCLFWDWARTRD
jgi:hypothetical protein